MNFGPAMLLTSRSHAVYHLSVYIDHPSHSKLLGANPDAFAWLSVVGVQICQSTFHGTRSCPMPAFKAPERPASPLHDKLDSVPVTPNAIPTLPAMHSPNARPMLYL